MLHLYLCFKSQQQFWQPKSLQITGQIIILSLCMSLSCTTACMSFSPLFKIKIKKHFTRNSLNKMYLLYITITCADPEGRQGVQTPLKNHKNIVFSSNTVLDPLKNRSYQASIQCWAIIGMPGKRHLMAFRWHADDGPLKVVLGSSLPSSTKKNKNKKTLSKLDPL